MNIAFNMKQLMEKFQIHFLFVGYESCLSEYYMTDFEDNSKASHRCDKEHI